MVVAMVVVARGGDVFWWGNYYDCYGGVHYLLVSPIRDDKFLDGALFVFWRIMVHLKDCITICFIRLMGVSIEIDC